jgi:glycyl-tRNA synthetase beta chain
MSRAPLLLEIGCEEIPARMIDAAAGDLVDRVVKVLTRAGFDRGEARAWAGPRRLAVRVEDVEAAQADREEEVLGPPASVAFGSDGELTRAALGFAKKQGVDPSQLGRRTTKKGEYVGFVRRVAGQALGAVLAEALPPTVAAMAFPKTMRWAEGRWRWVRPVHWILARHGAEVLEIELFGVRAGGWSMGHRFLSPGRVEVAHPDHYVEALERAHVVVEPAVRRERLCAGLRRAAEELGGRLVEDAALLDEVADLVEWPGTVAGRFDEAYLELPRELLVTTLRHHQKCFSVQSETGRLLPAFVAVANTDRDPGSHVRRGNEWVIGGRLEDARFFWAEDRKRPLADRSAELEGVVFHARAGTFADKATRLERLAREIAGRLDAGEEVAARCGLAARLAKNDLVTDTVGEFPELQGRVGGLLLRAEGEGEEIGAAVYAHYQPAGAEDPIPPTLEGCVVSVADKLDSVDRIILAEGRPTGSKDPFGLRRAGNGVLRILLERGWPLGLRHLQELVGEHAAAGSFLRERLTAFFKERGFAVNEIEAAMRPRISDTEVLDWPVADFAARLRAIQTVRGREDFRSLVKLTERVDTIVVKNEEVVRTISAGVPSDYAEPEAAATELDHLVRELAPRMQEQAEAGAYEEIVKVLARFVEPVERFFTDVLVIDGHNPNATSWRYDLLVRLRRLLTRYFDIRELAGQAERRST